MGTGSSKSKQKGKVVVAAEVVVEGQSQPIKVKGQVNLSENAGQQKGPAMVKQVAPNTYSLQMGSQSIGTFDVPNGSGDFAAYLANAATMTVTNIETVADEDGDSNGERINQSFQIQLSHQDTSQSRGQYSDDEDWEEVIQDLNAKENQPTSNKDEDPKERKARLKEVLQAKRIALSQQEYEQMIANHKQEVELMAVLRDKERERQKYTMESKVEQRRQRRLAKEREKKERQKLLEEKAAKIQTQKEPNGNHSNIPANKEQLEKEIHDRNAAFENEMKEKRDQLSEAEYQRLLAQHKSEMEKLRQKLDRETDRQKQSFEDKLEERKRRKMLDGGSSGKEMTVEEIRQLEADLKRRQAQFEAELRDKKSQLSDEDYKKLIATHKQELNQLQQTLDGQKERQRQSLLDKLAARKASKDNKEMQDGDAMSADEVKELQLALNQKAMDFKKKLKDSKGSLSSAEMEKLIKEHRLEMDHLQEQLDAEKERMRRVLMEKMEARKRKKRGKQASNGDTPPLTAEELKQLQLSLDIQDAKFRDEMKLKKSKISDKEYQLLMKKHKDEQDEISKTLASERERMEKTLQDKLAARKFRMPSARERVVSKKDEVNKLQQEILQRETTFDNEVKKKRSELSDADYQRLLAQHERDIERLKGRLALATERQKRNFTDKLAQRQRRKAQWQAEQEERMRIMAKLERNDADIDQDDVNNLEEDIALYNHEVRESIEEQKDKVSESEYRKMIEEHERNMEIFNRKLNSERERMLKVLEAKKRARGQKVGSGQEDEGTSDEELDNDDQSVSMVTLEVTQLWTTPTQSTSLVVVPLKDEYPVKRKRELYTDPSIFRNLDAHAIKLAQTVSLVTQPTFSSLVNELVSIGQTELEKVRLVFRWITAQNCEEMDLNDIIDDTPLGVLKGLYHKKITFSTLFMRMCRFFGLRCVEINGCAKNKTYNPGQYITPSDASYQHTWNAVRIDGYWHFLDCNWGVSHIQGSVAFDPFRFEYDEHYFLADPDVIIQSHFPNDPAWQLLKENLSLQDFNASVPLKPDFFKFGFRLLTHTSAVIKTQNGELDIRVQCPQGLILSTRLSTTQGGREFSKAGVPYDQFDFIHQMAENIMACYIRIPEPGDYYLTLYAKRQFMEGEINLETETEICRYLVHNDAPCNDQVPLPKAPADHWGPIGVMNVGLLPLTHRTAVVMNRDATDIEVRFKSTPTQLIFSHTLTSWGLEPEHLKAYSMQREFSEQLVFLVTPPKIGRYGLHIFAQYPGMPTPIHICSYLLVCAAVKPVVTPIPLLDKGENWGPSMASALLGMTAFTHPDPLIVTSDSNLQMVMARVLNINAYHELLYYGNKNPLNSNSQVSAQLDSQSVTYLISLSNPGYYRFTIKGKESDDPEIPVTPLFHYLIRKV
ncbi:uncharacterized protein [Asterias amurensis]|uniref:uncharacterized protein n=1 Tax=Asterias amurensis TaxID=7602 RepID=UPI003AB85C17